MWFPFEVPKEKQVRVIIDTDAGCEADDSFAVVHALLSRRLRIKGLIGAHFGIRNAEGNKESCKEITRLLDLMGMRDAIPVYRGAPYKLPSITKAVSSEGADFIISEAMKDNPLPLFVTCQGPLTDLASAYLKEPKIAERLTAIWIGGDVYPQGGIEFNLSNDVNAAKIIFDSPIPLWQVPKNVYDMVRVSLSELAVKVRPSGALGKYLFDRVIYFNQRYAKRTEWPKGETWVLGDSPSVSLLLDDQSFDFDCLEAPEISNDMSYMIRPGNRKIRVYRNVDSRFILEDFFAKLCLFTQSVSALKDQKESGCK